LEYNPFFQHLLDCNKQTYNPIQHVKNKQNIVFGLTYNPLAKQNYNNSRKTYKGGVSFCSKILDWKIPPIHYNPDFEVIN